MEEHGMYFAKKEFYEVIRTHGGVWNDSKEETMFSHEYQGRWSDIKRLCKLKSLMCLPTKEQTLVTSIVMWVFPVEFFSCFQHCYIATYLWNGSIQKNYFDLHHYHMNTSH